MAKNEQIIIIFFIVKLGFIIASVTKALLLSQNIVLEWRKPSESNPIKYIKPSKNTHWVLNLGQTVVLLCSK